MPGKRTRFGDLIKQVRKKAHILDVVEPYLKEKPSFSDSKVRACAPYRADTQPSLYLFTDTNKWFDHGTGKGGDVIDFFTLNYGYTVVEAVNHLAKTLGLDPARGALSKEFAEEMVISRAYTLAQVYFVDSLKDQHRQWLEDRYGFNISDIIRFGFGYDEGGDGLFKYLKEGMARYAKEETTFKDAHPLATGLFTLAGTDILSNLRGRITIPIFEGGKLVSFMGRAIDDGVEPKYKHLTQTSGKHPYISSLVHTDFILGIDSIGEAPALFCVEGAMDCFAAHKHGVPCISPDGLSFRPSIRDRALQAVKGRDVIVCFDAESSGAGKRGACETAAFLSQTANEVSIAQIPTTNDVEKLDLAEYLKRQGTNGKCFTALIDLMAFAKPFSEEDLTTETKNKEPPQTNSTIGLQVDYSGKRYKDRNGNPISTFILECTEIRTSEEEGDVFLVDIHTSKGSVYKNVSIPAVVFSDPRRFDAIVSKSADVSWEGKRTDLLSLKKLLAYSDAPRIQLTSAMGVVEKNGYLYWVSNDTMLKQDTAPDITPLKYTQPRAASLQEINHDLSHVARYDKSRVDLDKLKRALTILPNINDPAFIHPAIAWFMSAPLKSKLIGLVGKRQKNSVTLNGYPILWIIGSPSSGKSYTLERALLPLVGVRNVRHFLADATPYTMLPLLSSTNAIPIVLDEYRNGKANTDELHKQLRVVYRAGTDARGSSSGAVRTFALQAPVCVCGEDVPNDQALQQRIVTLQPFRSNIARGGKYHRAIHALDGLRLYDHAAYVIEFLLGRDVDTTLDAANVLLDHHTSGQTLEVRAHQNALAVLCGALWFEELCDELKVEGPRLDFDAIVGTLTKIEEDSQDREERSGLDYFMEAVCNMASDPSSHVEYGVHYRFQKKKNALVISITDIMALYHRWTYGKGSTLISKTSVRRLLRESAKSPDGYAIGNYPATLNGKTKYVTGFDIDLLNKTLPSADEFLRVNLEKAEEEYNAKGFDPV